MRGVGSLPCDECHRRFSGEHVFGAHRISGRCMTVRELRRRFRQHPDGTWTRAPREAGRQTRLWPQGRPPTPRQVFPGVYRHVRPRRGGRANRASFIGQLSLFLIVLTTWRAA